MESDRRKSSAAIDTDFRKAVNPYVSAFAADEVSTIIFTVYTLPFTLTHKGPPKNQFETRKGDVAIVNFSVKDFFPAFVCYARQGDVQKYLACLLQQITRNLTS